MNQPVKYKKCIVVFLDILGFKKIVETEKLAPFFSDLFSAINNLTQLGLKNMHLTDLKTAVLSDSFIASVPFKRASFNKILRFIFVVQYMLLQEGIVARGAITIGNLYHENNIVFGPALVNAYLLQEHNAIFPRTIIDEETLKICLGTTASAVDCKTTYNKFKKDSDGFWFYDFIGHVITPVSYTHLDVYKRQHNTPHWKWTGQSEPIASGNFSLRLPERICFLSAFPEP